MRQILNVILLLLICNVLFGQDTLHFELDTKLFKLGDVLITRHFDQAFDSVTYRLTTNINLWSLYKIDYLMESVYLDNKLCRSLTQIIVNGAMHHFALTEPKGNAYRVQSTDGNFMQKKPINTSITPLYFNSYSGPDSIFSEYSGTYKPWVKKNDTVYVLDPADPMEFIFADGKIKRVVVPNSILNFYIQKSSKP